MLKNFFIRQLIKRQFKEASDEQIDMILGVVEKNPQLFEKIGQEIKVATKAGKPQQQAAQEIMLKYKDQLLSVMK